MDSCRKSGCVALNLNLAMAHREREVNLVVVAVAVSIRECKHRASGTRTRRAQQGGGGLIAFRLGKGSRDIRALYSSLCSSSGYAAMSRRACDAGHRLSAGSRGCWESIVALQSPGFGPPFSWRRCLRQATYTNAQGQSRTGIWKDDKAQPSGPRAARLV